MVDKIKPLCLEELADGSQLDHIPTEASPNEDYAAVKGIAFENLDNFLVDKVGRTIVELFPTLYQSASYSGNDLSTLAFYNSSSFIIANRIAQYDFTYSGGSLTIEELKIYDTDGSTILRTYTWTHTYSSGLYQSSELVIT